MSQTTAATRISTTPKIKIHLPIIVPPCSRAVHPFPQLPRPKREPDHRQHHQPQDELEEDDGP